MRELKYSAHCALLDSAIAALDLVRAMLVSARPVLVLVRAALVPITPAHVPARPAFVSADALAFTMPLRFHQKVQVEKTYLANGEALLRPFRRTRTRLAASGPV